MKQAVGTRHVHRQAVAEALPAVTRRAADLLILEQLLATQRRVITALSGLPNVAPPAVGAVGVNDTERLGSRRSSQPMDASSRISPKRET